MQALRTAAGGQSLEMLPVLSGTKTTEALLALITGQPGTLLWGQQTENFQAVCVWGGAACSLGNGASEQDT